MAVQTALAFGFHHSTNKTRLQRMAWQICLVRDRMLSLAMRRPLQILPAYFPYEARILSLEEVTEHFQSSIIYPSSSRLHSAQTFTALCDLAVVMTNAIQLLYPADRGPLQSPGSLDEYHNSLSRCQECKDQISKWFVNVSLEFSPSMYTADNSTMVYASLLYFHY